MLSVCDVLVSAEEKLNDLDRGSGDGDCGTTLKEGALGIFSCWYIIPKPRIYLGTYSVSFFQA